MRWSSTARSAFLAACARHSALPGAIAKFDDADGTLGVAHTPGDCVKCGSCGDVCPAGAITLLDAVPVSWLTDGSRHRYVMTPRPVSLTDNPHQILDTFRLDFNGDIFER